MCEAKSPRGGEILYIPAEGVAEDSSLPVAIENEDKSVPEGENALESPDDEVVEGEIIQGQAGGRFSLCETPQVPQQDLLGRDDESDTEGIDPFSVNPQVRVSVDSGSFNRTDFITEERGSKNVNFEGDDVDGEENEEEKIKIENGNSYRKASTSSSSSSKGSYSMEEEKEKVVKRGSSNAERSLGEANPVYRLSMKLSPNLFNMKEIPGATQHREAEKCGYLTKLSGRSFPYLQQWKRRYCVLARGRLYYYEREDSRAGEKNNGVINLEYYDQVAEAAAKDCKKATNVFLITSQDRSFFDPGRHLFSADTLPDMKDWVKKLQLALEQIRNNNRAAISTSTSTKEGGKRKKEETVENKDELQTLTKDRKKKKDGSHHSRRSARVGVASETQTQETELKAMSNDKEMDQPAIRKGIQLPGMSSKKDTQVPARMSTSQKENEQLENGENLPSPGPVLDCVTKNRVKGPSGRRAPQNRRTLAAAALKKRASSLSALEYQDLNDNRSESSQGLGISNRNSRSSAENELDTVEESPNGNFDFDEIDKELFFSRKDREEKNGDMSGEMKEKKQSATLKVSFEERDSRSRSRSRSRNDTVFSRGKLSRIRETIISFKQKRFESKEPIGPDHPDMCSTSRWDSCSLL